MRCGRARANCPRRWSSRPRPPRCCRSSAVRQAPFGRCSRACSKTRCASARPSSATCLSTRTIPFAWSPCRMRPRPIGSFGSANRSWSSATNRASRLLICSHESGHSHYRSRCRKGLHRTQTACRRLGRRRWGAHNAAGANAQGGRVARQHRHLSPAGTTV